MRCGELIDLGVEEPRTSTALLQVAQSLRYAAFVEIGLNEAGAGRHTDPTVFRRGSARLIEAVNMGVRAAQCFPPFRCAGCGPMAPRRLPAWWRTRRG